MHEAAAIRTSTKLRNSFLFRFRRRENLKGQNSRLDTKFTIPLLNSLSLAYHDMRKTWCSGSGVYGAMLEVIRASEFSLPGIGVTV